MNIATISLALALGSLSVTRADLTKSTYTGSDGLNDMAKAAGKYMGTAVDTDLQDTAAVKVLENIKDFGMITPGNAMKWDATEGTQNAFTYEAADAIVAAAKESGAQVRCHTLTWHSQTPEWVQGLSKEEMLSALENHVTKVMTYFGDKCYAWDVANEVMGDDAQMRDSFWYKTTGMDFMATAFNTAAKVKKELGLKTKLYYNDYNTNTINAKSTAVLDMVKKLMDQGVPIEGVGFQSHFGFADPATTADQVANLERFTALGLDVALTEVDVTASSSSPSAEEQEQQSNVYKNTVAACAQVKRCVGVTIWGYDDNYSWLSTKAPLPWYQPGGKNTEMVRKSLYDGIVAGWGGASGAAQNSSAVNEAGSAAQTPSAETGSNAQTEGSQPTSASGSNTQSWGTGTDSTSSPAASSSSSNTQNEGGDTGAGAQTSGSHDKCNGRRKLRQMSGF